MTVFDLDNIILIYSSGTTSYQMDYNPKTFNYGYQHVQEKVAIGDGTAKYYHRGYLFHATLDFEWIKNDQYDAFRKIYNAHDEIIINPSPISANGASFGVMWDNDYSFTLVNGMTPFGYTGTIELVGTSLLNAIPDTFTLGSA